jgi:hypothetical protein
MVAISRVQLVFSGSAVVGPAASAFYTTGQVDDLRGPLIALVTQLVQRNPPSLTLTIPNSGEVYDDVTGDLQSLWTDGTTYSAVGTGSPVYAKGVGMRLVWDTLGITNNRRVRGSTFYVPISSNCFSEDGDILEAVRSAGQTAVDTFVAATVTDLSIWTRPKGGAPGKTSGVVAGRLVDKVATLRSRRV